MKLPDPTNKCLALKAMTVLAEGDLELADELIHPDFHNHEVSADRPGGPEGFRLTAASLRSSFADIRFEHCDVISAGDRVVVRCLFAARHTGPLAGMPATGRECSMRQIHIWRVQDGKLIEHWAVRDELSALRQLGLLSDRGHTSFRS